MPRKGAIAKREVLPDPLYNSKLVTRTINRLMLDGKRGKAATILYAAFDIVREQTGQDPMEVFEQAIENIMPLLEVEVRPERRYTLAIRWLVSYSRLRGEKTMELRLAREIMDAANNTGASVKKREDMHKMAEANKAFAHYRW